MRLLIDFSAAVNQGAGIGRYARGIVPSALLEIAGSPTMDVTLFLATDRPGPAVHEPEAVSALPGSIRFDMRRSPIGRKRLDQLWHRMGLNVGSSKIAGRADLVYSPDFFTPPLPGVAAAPTIHDLAFLVCPERTPEALARYLRAAIARQVESAAVVATVSETTRRDLIERLGVARERIVVVPNGVDERFFQATTPTEDQRRHLNLPDNYLLMVGTLEPRKNHAGVFDAMHRFESALDLPLVVAGRPGWQCEPILASAERLRRRGRVQFLSFVADRDLPALYAGAACLIYPSWYEGFGLPVLEAMAVGTPIVISSAPALLELAGGLAEVSDPANVEALGSAIVRVLGVASREEAARSRRQEAARGYTWSSAGKRLARLWRDFLG